MNLPVNYNELHWSQRKAVREEYIRIQNGKCAHCGKPLDGEPPRSILDIPITKELFPDNFFKYPIHLHHDHNTGMTIGALHNICNAVLWEHYGE